MDCTEHKWPYVDLVGEAELHYARLDAAAHETRLLRLKKRADFDAPVRGTLERHKLANAPPYAAISYQWSHEDPQDTVFLNYRALKVRRTCLYVLKQARKNSPVPHIWIDSVCIDQNNMEERSSQVQIMGDIFKRAVCTLASIDCATQHQDLLLGIVHTITRELGERSTLADIAKGRHGYSSSDCTQALLFRALAKLPMPQPGACQILPQLSMTL
jgi:hypothetical protein